MALIDTVLKIFTKTSKDPNASQPAVGSRSEREAKIKDKAGLVINIFALLLAVNAWYGGKLSSIVLNNTIASSNQWAWYQAKNVRESIYETAAIQSIDKENKEKLIAEAKRMEKDKKEIAENLNEIVNYCIKIKLLQLTNGYLHCDRLTFRLEEGVLLKRKGYCGNNAKRNQLSAVHGQGD